MVDLEMVKKVLDALLIDYKIIYNEDGSFYLTLPSSEGTWFKFSKENILLY